MNNTRRASGGISAAIFILGLIFALSINPFNLPIFFASMAFAILVGSFSSGKPGAVYGGIIGGMWMFILALFFVTHIWLLFLVGVLIIILMGTLFKPFISGLNRIPFTYTHNQPNQPYYQPPHSDQPRTSYQEGYQAPNSRQEAYYEEGNRQYQYPPQQSPQFEHPETQYNQPQAQYPPQMPPQQ
jgi:hypothetical protein